MADPRGASRRTLLGAGLAAGVLLGGCGSKDSGEPKTTTDQTNLGGSAAASDIEVLNASLDLEHESVAAYGAALEHLTGRAADSAKRFGEQERAHAEAIAEAIADLGGKANAAKEAGEYGFPAFEDSTAALEFITGIENTAIAWYIDALPKFSTAELRAKAASIVTVEAEQLSVLLGVADRPQVPDAFVLGRKT